MTDSTTANEDALEAMIDTFGLSEVIDFMVCICAKKASHLRENWKDESQAKEWSKAAQTLRKAEDAIPCAIQF